MAPLCFVAAARAIAMVLRAGSFGGCGALMLETPNPTGALAVSAFLSSRAVADVLDERVGGADGRLALLALLGSAVASRAAGRFASPPAAEERSALMSQAAV